MRLRRVIRNRLRLRLERRRLQIAAWRCQRELVPVADRTATIPPGPILLSVMRNEAVRLPWFLDWYRRLGVVHFLIVDNGSDDETRKMLAACPDVSLWHCEASYRESRYGVDWINALLARHGAGRWVLVVDPDEILVYPHCDTRRLPALTRWLEANRRDSLGTLLLDLYGRGPVAETVYHAGEDPVAAAPWFDAAPYVAERHPRYHNLWIQGGPRMRAFFADDPEGAPALNKTPLVRWRRGQVFRTSTHTLLPRHLNSTHAREGGAWTSGVLLHTKFLAPLAGKVREEMIRRQHYAASAEYRAYAARGDTGLWTPQSARYQGWQQLCDLGLMARGGWV